MSQIGPMRKKLKHANGANAHFAIAQCVRRLAFATRAHRERTKAKPFPLPHQAVSFTGCGLCRFGVREVARSHLGRSRMRFKVLLAYGVRCYSDPACRIWTMTCRF